MDKKKNILIIGACGGVGRAFLRTLLKEHRVADAMRISNELIAQYPDSPQAHALREQILPRLEQRAAS